MADPITSAWQQGLEQLAATGFELPPTGHDALRAARVEFEALASQAAHLPEFVRQGPRLAAQITAEILDRHSAGLSLAGDGGF